MAETNQINWRGVRPVSPVENLQTSVGIFETTVAGVTRTQINKSVEVNNTTVVIHTVTAGKTFYLVAAICSADAGIAKITHLAIRNAADTIQFIIFDFATAAQGIISDSVSFPVPIAIAAGWDIALITDNTHAGAFITGWEQ